MLLQYDIDHRIGETAMKQRVTIPQDRRTDLFRNMPPAANQELVQDKELHELWQEKYLRRTRRQERVTAKASAGWK